jgi:hypothetical protein
MTVGALIQLEYGNTDRMAFLTLNPQITHFKSVYRKYTNFATEFITVLPIQDSNLSWDSEQIIEFTIPRDGDAIRDIYLTLELPDIYSNSQYQFQWIKRIGEYIVKEVTIKLDTNDNIDKHYPEWLHAYSELNYNEGKKNGYYKMIGNIPEMYDPANAPGNNGTYPTTTYAPSIVNRKIYLPLIFWFNKYASLSFPIIATQKSELKIRFLLRKLKELYTIIDPTTGYRIRPISTQHYIGNFLVPGPGPVVNPSNNLNVTSRLEINNIFLDNEERKRFALSAHDYLITQVKKVSQTSNTNNIAIDLKDISKPVTEIVFMVRRTDMEDVNEWSNFTNWNVENVPPYSNGYTNPHGPPLTITTSNIKYYKTSNILKSATFKIQGNEITRGDVLNNDLPTSARLKGKDFIFYNLMENFYSNNNVPKEGIYTYSFSLDNSSLQPNGAINMSSLNKKELSLILTDINSNGYYINSKYNYNVFIFAVNYEILTIMGGIGGIKYAN